MARPMMLIGALVLVGAAAAAQEKGGATPDPEPTAVDEKAKITAKIARWKNNMDAAISLRFDDSHPSHITIAVPLLTRCGMVGTFFINPGRDAYQQHKEKWETQAIEGGHEFANHTMHHRGAKDDDEADREIGECSEFIWNLFPNKSKILAFRSGGGTTWNIQKPWSYYREKWHLISAPYSLSVGVDPEKCKIADMNTFKAKVEETVANKNWLSLYWHAIGAEEGMGVSKKDFTDQTYYLRNQRKKVWFGGIATIYKYQEERRRAKIAVKQIEPFKLKIDVMCDTDPALYDEPLTVAIMLPEGRWPVEDIQALDGEGNPMPMRRTTENWHVPMLSVPPVTGTYYIHVVDPFHGKEPPKCPEESERTVKDERTGIEATICKWCDGRRTAFSLRFDDSHPSHIEKAIPILRKYGFRGTFIVNPGNAGYLKHKAEWEAVAKAGDQEFGNHTMHHCGAKDDEEVEYEVGECSRILWGMFPDKSKLVNFCRGGGTTWTHTKPFRYWLDKYYLEKMYYDRFCPPAGGISMADSYGNRVEHFEKLLARCIERGEWMRTHYHQIGTSDGLGICEENFIKVHEITKQHEKDLWIAGMADIFMYYRERESSKLSIRNIDDSKAEIALSCMTDPDLYEQPLTLQVTLPEGWDAQQVRVADVAGNPIPTRKATVDGKTVVRFEAGPADTTVTLSRSE